MEFVHLHIHSEYSLLDGAIKLKTLIKSLTGMGFKAAALTDHENMHGAIEYYLAAKKSNLSPILGLEVNVLYEAKVSFPHKVGHLVLLAENLEGYTNLVRLCSLSNTQYKNNPDLDYCGVSNELLKQYGKGLICLTGCLKGELPQLLLKDEDSLAQEYYLKLLDIFGKENLFIEIWDNHLPLQEKARLKLIEFAKKNNQPLVATADVHYLKPEDQRIHLSLLAIKHKMRQDDLKEVDTSYQFHLTSAEEMYEKFSYIPEALENTVKIAERCQVPIDTKSVFMPDYRLKEEEPADACMERLSWEGLETRKEDIIAWQKETFNDDVWESYKERLRYEIDIINKMRFAGYFLIVQDFINWAKDHDIPVGPGRGSAAGSLVTYCLRITNIDPIRFNLLFERFLNPERISMPDIDTDFCMDRRQEVIQYVYEKYGERAVAQIVTFGRLKAKNALKSLARILGWSFTDSNNFAKLIPEAPGTTLDQAFQEEPKIKEMYEKEEKVKILWDASLEIEGVLNSTGVHAAGVIISDGPIDVRCPLLETDGQLITQYEYKYAESIGLIKFDFLGLKTLTVIKRAVDLLKERHDPNFNIDRIYLDDPKVYEMICTAHVTGVFQLESAGMRKLISEMKPSCFTDIIAILALFRPGPLGSGMVEEFVERKHGRRVVDYPFSILEPILKDTYGTIIYQEQVQKIAAVLASYSLGEADLLRRAMGKKDKDEMARQKIRFVDGSVKNNYDETKVSDLFDLLAKFAEYGFNKSHTAAYGYVCYQTAFLKTYYPAEFMCGIMSCDFDDSDKIVTYVRDCKRMKIEILPPTVNMSSFEFKMTKEGAIQFGLGAIKGLGSGVVKVLEQERSERGFFYTVPEFMARMYQKDSRILNKKVMESLIKAGAFDDIATNRQELFENMDSWLRTISKEVDREKNTTSGLFDMLVPSKPEEKKYPPLELKSGFSPKRLKTQISYPGCIVSNLLLSVTMKKAEPWSFFFLLEAEDQTLGFYISGHPADPFMDDFQFVSHFSLVEAPLKVDATEKFQRYKEPQKVAGLITAVFEKRTQEGEKFAVYKLEDGVGELEITVFPKMYASFEKPPQKGQLIWVDVRLKPGSESGTVRATANSIGFIEEERKNNLKALSLECSNHFLKQPQIQEQLVSFFSKYKGNCSLRLETVIDSYKVRWSQSALGIEVKDHFFYELLNKWPGEFKMKKVYGQEF